MAEVPEPLFSVRCMHQQNSGDDLVVHEFECAVEQLQQIPFFRAIVTHDQNCQSNSTDRSLFSEITSRTICLRLIAIETQEWEKSATDCYKTIFGIILNDNCPQNAEDMYMTIHALSQFMCLDYLPVVIRRCIKCIQDSQQFYDTIASVIIWFNQDESSIIESFPGTKDSCFELLQDIALSLHVGESVAPMSYQQSLLCQTTMIMEIFELLLTLSNTTLAFQNNNINRMLSMFLILYRGISNRVPMHHSLMFPATLIVNPPTVTIDLDALTKVAPKFSEFFMGEMFSRPNWNSYVLIAGGAVLHAINNCCQTSDVDIFIYGDDDIACKNVFLEITEALYCRYGKFAGYRDMRHSSLIEFTLTDYHKETIEKIQIIWSGSKTIEEVLTTFDFCYVQWGWTRSSNDQSMLYCTPEALMALRSGATYHTGYQPYQIKQRISKAMDKGFKIDLRDGHVVMAPSLWWRRYPFLDNVAHSRSRETEEYGPRHVGGRVLQRYERSEANRGFCCIHHEKLFKDSNDYVPMRCPLLTLNNHSRQTNAFNPFAEVRTHSSHGSHRPTIKPSKAANSFCMDFIKVQSLGIFGSLFCHVSRELFDLVMTPKTFTLSRKDTVNPCSHLASKIFGTVDEYGNPMIPIIIATTTLIYSTKSQSLADIYEPSHYPYRRNINHDDGRHGINPGDFISGTFVWRCRETECCNVKYELQAVSLWVYDKSLESVKTIMKMRDDCPAVTLRSFGYYHPLLGNYRPDIEIYKTFKFMYKVMFDRCTKNANTRHGHHQIYDLAVPRMNKYLVGLGLPQVPWQLATLFSNLILWDAREWNEERCKLIPCWRKYLLELQIAEGHIEPEAVTFDTIDNEYVTTLVFGNVQFTWTMDIAIMKPDACNVFVQDVPSNCNIPSLQWSLSEWLVNKIRDLFVVLNPAGRVSDDSLPLYNTYREILFPHSLPADDLTMLYRLFRNDAMP